jgi:CheY-like chemotaxis protein
MINKKILLAEDDLLDKELAINTLRSINIQNEIMHFDNGQSVIDYMSDINNVKDIGLIVLDLKMPKLTGIQVLKCLKENSLTKYIPVVILSSSKEHKDVTECYSLGANSYIVKPVDVFKYEESIKLLGKYWLSINHINFIN